MGAQAADGLRAPERGIAGMAAILSAGHGTIAAFHHVHLACAIISLAAAAVAALLPAPVLSDR
ncbi:hypothetical protein [Spirillospora sp. NPDC047279]|uniref:hypothetical protein n=1 Tax=Spirillospora sp. NPDC047279 TaxID=3155478 RepID=UPI0034072C0E